LLKFVIFQTIIKKNYYYILSPKNLKILDIVYPSNKEKSIENNQKYFGSYYLLKDFNVGDFIYNIEINPNCGGKIVRSAGTFAQILQKRENTVLVSLPSGEHRLFFNNCKACFGNVSNENFNNITIGKAGRSR